MNGKTSRELVLVVILGLLVTAILYSSWWKTCCDATGSVIALFLSPGLIIGMIIGGGPHSAPKAAFYLGVVIQFLIMWFIYRAILRKRNARNKNNDI